MSLKPANEGAGGVDLGGSVNAGKAAGATLGANDNCTSHCEAGIVANGTCSDEKENHEP